LVYEAGAKYNKKLSLELGGKNANIIFADCNFEDAVSTTIRSSFANQGEICLCGSRVFVERPIFDRFINELTKRAESIMVGDPTANYTGMHIGALVSKQHMDKVLSYIELAKSRGYKIHTGGYRVMTEGLDKGYFVRPTIVTGYSLSNLVWILLTVLYNKKKSLALL
jgi:aminomuconate-semialdehyde/2-hydroxymuconate-6-semialdehyde dehydrogenase